MSFTDTMGKNALSKFTSISQFDDATAETLGKGGFGYVKAMTYLHDGQVYAVKSVKIAVIMQLVDESETAKMKKMIFDEARLLRDLDHENIVKVYGSFLEGDEDSGIFYIVMEFCVGGSLKKLIRETKDGFEEVKIIDWSSQIINGLAFLHSKQILHRDIKADNILLDAEHRLVKIGDFGISKVSNKTIISAKTAIGTVSHMPPEVIKGESYEWQSDVWSLGVVMFNLCARQLPFDSGIDYALKSAIVNDPIPSIPERFSQQLRDVLTCKILVKDPKLRATPEQLSKEPPFADHTLLRLKKENETLQQQVRQLSKTIATEQQKSAKLANDLDASKNGNDTLQRRNAKLDSDLRRSEQEMFALQQKVAQDLADNESVVVDLKNAIDDLKRELEASKQMADRLALENGRLQARNDESAGPTVFNGQLPKPVVVKGRTEPDVRLVEAAEKGDYNQVAKLIAASAHVNDSKNKQGEMALIRAAEKGHEKVVSLLLANKTEVNSQEYTGYTALMWAARNGRDEVVGHLLENNAKVNIQNHNGWTALMWAARNGRDEVVGQLLENNAKVNIQNNNGWTALIWAARYDRDKVVSLLLANKAEVNIQNNDGWTALMYAAEKGHDKVVSLLLANKAEVNIQNNDGWTALMYAAREGQDKVASLLLENNAEVNSQDKNGWTALMKAAYMGHDKVVSLLLANNPEVNSQGKNGWTALMYAASNGHDKVVSLLLASNANVHLEAGIGITALYLAREHKAIADMLIAKGATEEWQLNLLPIKFGGIEFTN